MLSPHGGTPACSHIALPILPHLLTTPPQPRAPPPPPVTISYALVSLDSASLWVDEAKLTPAVREQLALEGVGVRPYEEIVPALQK